MYLIEMDRSGSEVARPMRGARFTCRAQVGLSSIVVAEIGPDVDPAGCCRQASRTLRFDVNVTRRTRLSVDAATQTKTMMPNVAFHCDRIANVHVLQEEIPS